MREGSDNKKIPCVNINAKSAIKLVSQNAANAKIVLNQDEWIGDSHNVILDLPGETDEMIVLSAHYDSNPSVTGCIRQYVRKCWSSWYCRLFQTASTSL